jgi:hypothetical protein
MIKQLVKDLGRGRKIQDAKERHSHLAYNFLFCFVVVWIVFFLLLIGIRPFACSVVVSASLRHHDENLNSNCHEEFKKSHEIPWENKLKRVARRSFGSLFNKGGGVLR